MSTKTLYIIIFTIFASTSVAQNRMLKKFPEGYTPEEVGIKVANRFLSGKHMLHGGKWIHYAEVCTWYGAVRFASESKNKELSRQLQERFDYLCTAERDLLPIKNHVDLNMIGCLPLELYQITKKIQYLDLGISYADTQWELPAEASAEEKRWADKGLSWQTRLWIDDMYMITILQSQAYRATGNRKYIDRTARSMAVYLDELQRPNGLFYHAPDVPFLWGRGNGWMAAGMAELLKVLPKDNPGSSAYPTGVSRYDEKFKTISGRKRYVEPVDRRSRLLERDFRNGDVYLRHDHRRKARLAESPGICSCSP